LRTRSLIAAAVQREHEEWITAMVEALGETTVTVPREHLVSACGFLKVAPGFEFDFLADLCGFDRGPEEEPRFEVNYHLFSTRSYKWVIVDFNTRFRFGPTIESDRKSIRLNYSHS